jgi:hypothetical protein
MADWSIGASQYQFLFDGQLGYELWAEDGGAIGIIVAT